jgi:Fe-S-cluster containining protein
VWVTREDIRRIAAYLGREEGWLGREHLRRVGLRHSLTERPDGDCIFLQRAEGKTSCAIHPVRPLQCRTWPFWSENLRSATKWAEAGLKCPGINTGQLHAAEVIEALRRGRLG